jgi:hypothetical protein
MGLKFPGAEGILDEYCVMNSSPLDLGTFALAGDNGAAVVSETGEIVGLVHACISYRETKIAIPPTAASPDLEEFLNPEKSPHTTSYQSVFDWAECSFALIQDATLIRESAGLGEMVIVRRF